MSSAPTLPTERELDELLRRSNTCEYPRLETLVAELERDLIDLQAEWKATQPKPKGQ